MKLLKCRPKNQAKTARARAVKSLDETLSLDSSARLARSSKVKLVLCSEERCCSRTLFL